MYCTCMCTLLDHSCVLVHVHVHGICIILIVGPFVDKIRRMDDPEAQNIVMPSAG